MTQTSTLQRRALVIEDEGEMGLLLNLFLDEKDLDLDYVKDISSAEEYLATQDPDVIILDNKLPDGYGVDFIGTLKKKYPHVKVVMISGYGAARDVAMENGADAFLEKPFTKSEFYRAIGDIRK